MKRLLSKIFSFTKNNKKAEYIICSAIWYIDLPTQEFLPKNIDKGIVVCGHRHANCINITSNLSKLRSVKFAIDGVGESIQGFLTNTNRFVDREEGAKIAYKARQITHKKFELYSEDIY